MSDITIVAALAADRVIGCLDGLPWRLPDEYEDFLRRVENQTVLIGRRSFEIFGSDLRNTTNIVVSRSVPSTPGAKVFPSIEDALRAVAGSPGEVFCVGGAQMYRQVLPLAQRMILSFVKGTYAGDSYFPVFEPEHWLETARERFEHFDRVELRRTRLS